MEDWLEIRCGVTEEVRVLLDGARPESKRAFLSYLAGVASKADRDRQIASQGRSERPRRALNPVVSRSRR